MISLAPAGKLKRKARHPIAPLQLPSCIECGKYLQDAVNGVQHPFCGKTCSRKHNKRILAMAAFVPIMPIVPPQPKLCKGCGLKFQELSPQGCFLTHCSATCASKWPLRCASKGCEEFVSGAYGAYCAVAHKHLYASQYMMPPPTAQPKGFRMLDRLRVFSRQNHRVLFYDKHDPYFGFTNFSAHPITYKGKVYPTSEHLYQSLKFAKTSPNIAEHIRTFSENPRVAFNEAHKFQQYGRPDWLQVNISMMEEALWHKFTQHPYLWAELLSTGDAELIEDSPSDAFWGIGRDRNGRNELGKALMRLRSRLQT